MSIAQPHIVLPFRSPKILTYSKHTFNMIYSGKESQTTSNVTDGGAITVPAPVLTTQLSINSDYSTPETPSPIDGIPRELSAPVYYNARLDPKNFVEGPLSPNPATRLRQMLARPGIVVRSTRLYSDLKIYVLMSILQGCPRDLRRYQRTLCPRGRIRLLISKV